MNKFETLINSEKPVLIDFFATWCGPCQTMIPVLDKLKTLKKSSLTIIKIDVDKNQALANRFKIKSVPTFMIFKEGKMLWRESATFTLKGLSDKIDKVI
jgi:thioredoxin 1